MKIKEHNGGFRVHVIVNGCGYSVEGTNGTLSFTTGTGISISIGSLGIEIPSFDVYDSRAEEIDNVLAILREYTYTLSKRELHRFTKEELYDELFRRCNGLTNNLPNNGGN